MPMAGRAPSGFGLKCPYCGHRTSYVVDSREGVRESFRRRRRTCMKCRRSYTTYEVPEEQQAYVRRNDGRVEPYDRTVLLRSIEDALPSDQNGRDIALAIEQEITAQIPIDHEVAVENLESAVISKLFQTYPVAAVRYASVVKNFQKPEDFKAYIKVMRERGVAQR